jgi:hypothetical protein
LLLPGGKGNINKTCRQVLFLKIAKAKSLVYCEDLENELLDTVEESATTQAIETVATWKFFPKEEAKEENGPAWDERS